MADLNEVRIIGRLTRDPDLRATQNGTNLCQIGLAVNRQYKGTDGTMQKETTFIDVTIWGNTASAVAKYLKKGSLCFIGGRLKLDSWQDKQTGEKKSKLSVVAENVQFLDRNGNSEQQEYSQPTQQQYSQQTTQQPLQPTPTQTKPLPLGQQWSPTWNEPELGEPPF